jgi:hypothetical protein
MPKLSSAFHRTPDMPLQKPVEKLCLKESCVLHYLCGCVQAGYRSCIIDLTPCEIIVGDETSAELEVVERGSERTNFNVE